MLDKMNDLYKQMLENYEGGLSNTSTKKFDGIVSAIAELLDIPVVEVYATGSGTRPGNLEVRLSQGVRATTHTTVGLGFIIDDKNDPENVEKLTNSALVTCEKFLGRGKAHYDNIVIFVESNGIIVASGIIYQKKTEIAKKLIDELQINIIREVSMTSGISEINDSHNSHLNYLSALRTKPFMLLAGISGTGKSRIVRKLAQASTTQKYENTEDRWKDNRPENFELIQVKPNWHNSMDVVGYYSNVAKRYEFPPFIDFIVKAWQDLETPYFLCLDEMNLAPVEQYFAEFLSAIESRSFDADGNYVTDPIIKPFKKFGEKEGKAMLKQLFGEADPIDKNPLAVQFYEKGLTLPKNLLVMGTVNMDETTFSFSRKVLDRAMSVVMNEVDYEGFFDGNTENDVAEMDDATRNLLIDSPIRGLEAENNEADAVKEYLTKINEKLNDTPFKLGYRAANEALLYVSAAYKFNPDADIHVALDEFTMMKILSRIEGDKRSIGNLLDELKEVITNDYPKSNEKLEKMAETLKNKQFVSYWT